MNKETIVKSLRQVGFDEAQSLQLVNAMEDVSEFKINPVVNEIKVISEKFEAKVHQEISNLTWRFIGVNLAFLGALAAILKFIH